MNKAAQALGRLGKGKKKTITEVERQRRKDWMNEMNQSRRKPVTPLPEMK